MRILVNDHSGHPFQVQLSRALAKRGHVVTHAYSASFQTPKGALKRRPDDSDHFDIRGIRHAKPFKKYSMVYRRFQEREYGFKLSQLIRDFKPDIVVCSNTPLDAQLVILKECKQRGIKFIFWVQDIYSIAIRAILSKKVPFVGRFIAAYYQFLERYQLRESDAIVVITEDFTPLLEAWGISKSKYWVIPNWAPLEELSERTKENRWSGKHGIDRKIVILYSGTLGMKHNPEILVKIAQHFEEREDIAIVVVSEGLGAKFLWKRKKELSLHNLYLMDFQPFEDLPDVLSSADVFLAILESEAGVFSVPSKVLTYMCFQRPLVLAVPSENLAARIVLTSKSGYVVDPGSDGEILARLDDLVNDASLRRILGQNALNYARANFDISTKSDSFESIFSQLSLS